MATIHDVAQQAGVSPTTVSRYLNHRIELPPGTSARIDDAIDAAMARHLLRRTRRRIRIRRQSARGDFLRGSDDQRRCGSH